MKTALSLVFGFVLAGWVIGSYFMIDNAWQLHVTACEMHIASVDDFHARFPDEDSGEWNDTYAQCKSDVGR